MSQISQTNFKRRLTLALALPLLLLSLLAASLIGQISHLTSVMQWVNHTDQVLAQANYTEKLFVDMETGLRGYLVTGNTEFLEPYQQGSLTIAPAFAQLGRLVSDNPLQLQRLRLLQSDYQQWKRYAQQMMALKQQGGDYQAYAINAQGKKQMDAIRSRIASLIETEQTLLNTRNQDVQRITQFLLVTRIVLFLGAGIILVLFIRHQLLAVAQSYGRALAVAKEQTEAVRESEAALRRSAQRLATLHQIDRDILSAQSSEALVVTALLRTRQLVPCQQAFVVLFNFETRTAQVIAGSTNEDLNLPAGNLMPLEAFVPNELEHRTRYVEDMEDKVALESCPSVLKPLLSQGARSYITVPLLVEENLIGELSLVATQKAAFSSEYQEIVQEVAAQLAIAMQQSNLRQQLQNYTTELEQRVSDRTQELQETNAELEAFTYSVSHDLRAPLRTMQGFTQALLEDYGDQLDSMGQEYGRYIIESALQMDKLIADLLAYSRLSRAEIQLQPIDLSSVIAQVLNQDEQLRSQQAHITVEEPLFLVMAHRTTLVQVLTNLLANALKFVKPGVQPQVRVWAEERGGNFWGDSVQQPSSLSPHSPHWVRLWVEDNGIGIEPQYHERIFRVFERLHGVETYPGTGIGLAIVRKGIERLDGRVGLESEPDRGSRFWIELPKSG